MANTVDIMNKLNYLDTTKQQLRAALRDKGQEVPLQAPFRDYVQILRDMTIGTDTMDADATEYDIVSPYTAYAKNRKITGRLVKINQDYSFDNIEIYQNNDSTSNLIKDYTMKDNQVFHREYFNGINLEGKDFLIYMRPDHTEHDAIVFTWPNTQTLKININNNTMILDSYNKNTKTNDLITYNNLFLNGNPTITEGTFEDNYFGNSSYYSTNDVYSLNQTLIFEKCESLSYKYITINQTFDESKAIPSNFKNILVIEQQDIAKWIGLTPDMIKKDCKVLGITGTYEGEIPSQTIEQINNNLEEILGINNS